MPFLREDERNEVILFETMVAFYRSGAGCCVSFCPDRLVFGPQWAAEGVFMLFAVLFMFIGAQFVGMGLLGEYIGRIYNDVRARPRYFIQRVVRQEHKVSQEENHP